MSQKTMMWAARMHWSSGEEPSLAARTLLSLAERNVPALVELRCAEGGHFLGAVHGTRYGLLLWTKPARHRYAPALQQAAKQAAPEHFGDHEFRPTSYRLCAFEEEVRAWPADPAGYPLFCRCGQNALVFDDVFDAAHTAMAESRKVVMSAPLCERQ